MQFADLLLQDIPRPGPDSHSTTEGYRTFELMVRAHGSSPTRSFLLCSLLSDVLGLSQGAYINIIIPCPRTSEAAAGCYR